MTDEEILNLAKKSGMFLSIPSEQSVLEFAKKLTQESALHCISLFGQLQDALDKIEALKRKV